jgi:hypothetical protein
MGEHATLGRVSLRWVNPAAKMDLLALVSRARAVVAIAAPIGQHQADEVKR